MAVACRDGGMDDVEVQGEALEAPRDGVRGGGLVEKEDR